MERSARCKKKRIDEEPYLHFIVFSRRHGEGYQVLGPESMSQIPNISQTTVSKKKLYNLAEETRERERGIVFFCLNIYIHIFGLVGREMMRVVVAPELFM